MDTIEPEGDQAQERDIQDLVDGAVVADAADTLLAGEAIEEDEDVLQLSF